MFSRPYSKLSVLPLSIGKRHRRSSKESEYGFHPKILQSGMEGTTMTPLIGKVASVNIAVIVSSRNSQACALSSGEARLLVGGANAPPKICKNSGFV